jgi:hypothetical protein
MNRAKKNLFLAGSTLLIMALGACNNLGLMDQLETPGQAGSTNNISPDIFLFATTNSFNGNIRGGMADPRTAADIQCQNTRTTLTFPNNACSKVRAVISLSSADSIANIPLNYGLPVNISVTRPNNFRNRERLGPLVAGTSRHILWFPVTVSCQPRTKWWSFSTLGVTTTGQTTAPAAMKAQPAWVAAEIPILRVTRGYRAADQLSRARAFTVRLLLRSHRFFFHKPAKR